MTTPNHPDPLAAEVDELLVGLNKRLDNAAARYVGGDKKAREDWKDAYIEARTRIMALVGRARIEELEALQDMMDQEVDPDGRPVTKPYQIINEQTDYVINQRIAQLKEDTPHA